MINLDKKYGTRKISQKEKQISVEFFKQSSGISYLKSEILCNGRIKRDRQKSKKYLFLMFNEAKNDLCFKLDKKEYILNKDEFCIGLVNDDFKGIFEYQNKFYKTKTLLFDESYANKLEIFAGLRFDDKFELLKHKKDLAQICVLNELDTTNLYEGAMREIFTESKILELIYKSKIQKEREISLSRDEEKILLKAKTILLSRMQNPPSIKELAHLCGTNDFWLKKNFKLFFKDTIYQLLAKERLKLAFTLLKQNDISIKEAANIVGYTNTAHFAKIFKINFGFLPSKLLKTKSYF
ncbi:helix-turn-helix domain-containing protein [Campylobacter concisus]|uniref:helix-turn-helix domain-containing protein n=1 Tax=Campylobacter concisus TaxID=199 RepID=UPI000D302A9D|nr:AraC family transcriptional regulator [Campylobacter concisus]